MLGLGRVGRCLGGGGGGGRDICFCFKNKHLVLGELCLPGEQTERHRSAPSCKNGQKHEDLPVNFNFTVIFFQGAYFCIQC